MLEGSVGTIDGSGGGETGAKQSHVVETRTEGIYSADR